MQKPASASDDGKAISDAAPKNRAERRREDTHRRLLRAAYEIIANRGFEGLVIQDITEAADVGYGSFYNHFESKDAIVSAVIDAACDRIDEIYKSMASLTNDRAEALARDLRMCLYLTQTDKVWGWFVIRTIPSRKELRSSIREHIQRGIYAGLKDGVFTYDDAEMACEIISGLLLLGTIKLVFDEAADDYSDNIVTTALKTLGVRDGKIREVISKSFPELDLPPFLDGAK